ncbi:MAG: cytochrome C [Chromatiales bacterium]|nr:MAG: cytochrome C [Chromatiales bacterium]
MRGVGKSLLRRLPVTPTLGLVLAVVLAPAASASVLEKLVMPGPVAAAHQDIEGECAQCHIRGSGISEQKLCVNCHQRVGRDIDSGSGFHGKNTRAATENCSSCHTDHEGRDASMIDFDPNVFDHAFTDFPLSGAHAVAECESCHRSGTVYAATASECVACHREQDPHREQLGTSCGDCHSESEWTGATFEHDLTGFLLTGAHTKATCESCHRSPVFADASPRCVDCHRNEDVHKGGNGENCGDCHATSNWSSLRFDHLGLTGFGLSGGHDGLTCDSCHATADFAAQRDATCHTCHAGDDVHSGSLGSDCASCHAVADWAVTSFDHSAVSNFELRGAHTSAPCAACHTGSAAEPVASECGACHADDDSHRGQLGANCASCHGEVTWAEGIRFDHGLTAFPLLGQHEQLVCASCHESQAFHDAAAGCADCHGEDDPHAGALGQECGECHNPASWNATLFDHDTATQFALTGEHIGLACDACHRDSATAAASVPTQCGQCHQRDDRHDGRFGPDCGSCHSTTSFARVAEL